MKGNQMNALPFASPVQLQRSARAATVAAAMIGVLLLSGCAFRSVDRAPVEDRGSAVAGVPAAALATAPGTPASIEQRGASTLPENAGPPGYYTVKPGDTLIRIGLDSGQNWRDIVRWNAIENPNVIEVGQVLRVYPPGAVPVGTALDRPVVSVVPAPTSLPPAAGAATGPVAGGQKPAPAAAPAPDEELVWAWPANGVLVGSFDEVKNKGLDIGGATGEAVLAAADGRVVYVGAGLRGYGNLIILKHNNTYLTAYAHNQTLLVKEDQSVRKGQKIAEMGSSDTDRVKLHFEVRRQGKPVDPAKYLPPR